MAAKGDQEPKWDPRTDDGVQLCHGHLLGPLHSLHHFVAGAINERSEAEYTIICFLVGQEQLFLTCPLTLITCTKTGFRGLHIQIKAPVVED